MRDFLFGADIGGTTVKLGLFTAQGELLEKWEIRTDTSGGGANILPDTAASMKEKLEQKGIGADAVEGVGLAVPGPVDADGVVLKCVNLGWGVFNVQDEMEALTGWRCLAGNDANVAALGEMYQGAGKGHDSLVMMTLGTGIGGGVILGGKILNGAHGAAGEIGHIPVRDDETERCGCGKCGCLEQYASARGFARFVKKKLRQTGQESVLRRMDDFTGKEIFDAAKEGDAFALSMVDELGRMLGRAGAQIACVADPEVFVVGGGLSKAGPILTDAAERHYKTYAFHASRGTGFAQATLGNDAGIYGCAKLIIGQEG